MNWKRLRKYVRLCKERGQRVNANGHALLAQIHSELASQEESQREAETMLEESAPAAGVQEEVSNPLLEKAELA